LFQHQQLGSGSGTRCCGPRGGAEVSRIQYSDLPTYRISDYKGREIQGTYYEQELQRTKLLKKHIQCRIENIIQKREKKYLVKLLGYQDSFFQFVVR